MNSRFLIRGLLPTLALMFAEIAFAQVGGSAGQGKWYVGGAIGRSFYDADFERTKAAIQSTRATSFSGSANATDTMWKGYAGYRMSPNFSVEAGYWNLGRVDFSAAITAPVVATLQRNYRTDGYGAGAVLSLPVTSTWSGLLKAGAIRTATKASASDPGMGLTPLSAESSHKINPHWGVGLEYRLTSAASARIEYENIRKIGDESKFGVADINLWTIGANYRF